MLFWLWIDTLWTREVSRWVFCRGGASARHAAFASGERPNSVIMKTRDPKVRAKQKIPHLLSTLAVDFQETDTPGKRAGRGHRYGHGPPGSTTGGDTGEEATRGTGSILRSSLMGLAKGIYKYTPVSRKTMSEILSSAKNRCDLLEATDHIPESWFPALGLGRRVGTR